MKWLAWGLCLLLIPVSVQAWDTKTHHFEGNNEPEWKSIYLSSLRNTNEHLSMAQDSLEIIGAHDLKPFGPNPPFLIVDLNASFFRQNVFGIGADTDPDIDIPADDPDTELEERALPAPAQFAGLPDFSYTISDWINKNILCPAVPDFATNLNNFLDFSDVITDPVINSDVKKNLASRDVCHDFLGWMGLLNANHFGTQATANYKHYHSMALHRAADAFRLHEALDQRADGSLDAHRNFVREMELQALSFEGIGQHFFQDRWSSGHMWERWDGPDWHSLDIEPLNRNSFTRHAHVSAIAGMLHGHESIFGVPDLMCSPGEDFEPMDWAYGDNQPSFFGMGDYRYQNVLDNTFQPPGEGPVMVNVAAQKDKMLNCLSAGWAEVIRGFRQNPDGSYGALNIPLNATGQQLSIGNDCFGMWATNRSMFRGYSEGLGIGEDGLLRGLIGTLVSRFGGMVGDSFFSFAIRQVTPEDPGRRDRIKLWYQLSVAADLAPQKVDVAQRELLDLSDVPFGGAFPEVPDYAEPQDLTKLPKGPISFFVNNPKDERPGLDKSSMFGFFNRAHTDWWCKADNVLFILNRLRQDSADPLAVETCTYLASRIYRGTDERYVGAQMERQKFLTEGGARIEVPPMCELPVLGSDLREGDADISDGNPSLLAPGYVERPDALAVDNGPDGPTDYMPPFGYDSIANWCRRIPVIDLLPDEEFPERLHREDLVAEVNDPDEPQIITLNGRHFGQVPGELLVGDQPASASWLQVIDWQPNQITATVAVDAARGSGDFALTVRKAEEPGHPALDSVGRAVLRIPGEECGGAVVENFDPDLEAIRGCTVINGNLTINIADESGDIELPVLREVTGDVLVFGGNQITTLDLPVLSQVGGFFRLSIMPKLTTVLLPRLNKVKGDFLLLNNLGFSDLDLPLLRDLGGDLEIGGLDSLVGFGAPALESVGGKVDINQNSMLQQVDLPVLTSVGAVLTGTTGTAFNLNDLPALGSLDIGSLEGLSGSLVSVNSGDCLDISANILASAHNIIVNKNGSVPPHRGVCNISFNGLTQLTGTLDVSANTELLSVSLPQLMTVGLSLRLLSNGKLNALNISSLSKVATNPAASGEFSIASNLMLPSIDAPALSNAGIKLEIRGNTELSNLNLGVQGAVETVQIVGNGFADFSLGEIDKVRLLDISGNSNMSTFSMGGLTEVNSLVVNDNAELTAGGFGISSAIKLGFPFDPENDPNGIGGGDIFNNNELSQCFVQDFCENVNLHSGASCEFGDNNTDPPWPVCL